MRLHRKDHDCVVGRLQIAESTGSGKDSITSLTIGDAVPARHSENRKTATGGNAAGNDCVREWMKEMQQQLLH